MISKRYFRLKKNGESYSNCFCKTPELIENYDKAISDTTQIWECHHRLEAHNSDGERRLVDFSREELIEMGRYYNVKPEELIFLTHKEHQSLHYKGNKYNIGKHHSEETKKKISESLKGRVSNRKGKHHLEETKKKLSEANKGKHWYNNGKINIFTIECPKGFIPGRIRK